MVRNYHITESITTMDYTPIGKHEANSKATSTTAIKLERWQSLQIRVSAAACQPGLQKLYSRFCDCKRGLCLHATGFAPRRSPLSARNPAGDIRVLYTPMPPRTSHFRAPKHRRKQFCHLVPRRIPVPQNHQTQIPLPSYHVSKDKAHPHHGPVWKETYTSCNVPRHTAGSVSSKHLAK